MHGSEYATHPVRLTIGTSDTGRLIRAPFGT